MKAGSGAVRGGRLLLLLKTLGAPDLSPSCFSGQGPSASQTGVTFLQGHCDDAHGRCQGHALLFEAVLRVRLWAISLTM